MEKYSYCTSTDFKKDISELCECCPLAERIETGLINQIIAQADIQREILSEADFEDYLRSEIKKAQQAMEKAFLIEQQNKDNQNDLHRKDRILHFLWNKERIKALNKFLGDKKGSGIKNKGQEKVPKTFEDLFYKPELIESCVNVLKIVEPPLLSSDNKYIGRLKGAFCVWADELLRQGFIRHYTDRKIYAELISQKFSPFTIDESMFGKIHPRANEMYLIDFKNLLSQISQTESKESKES